MKSDEARRSHLDPRQIDSLFAQDEYYTRAFTWAFGLYSSHIDEMINAAIPHIRRRERHPAESTAPFRRQFRFHFCSEHSTGPRPRASLLLALRA